MVNVHQVEVVVHVDDALSADQRAKLVGSLMNHAGVEDAHFTAGLDHLLLVDYDRDRLHAQDVLGYLRENHVAAELVGPV